MIRLLLFITGTFQLFAIAADDIARRLDTVGVSRVETEGQVLDIQYGSGVTEYLIGISVEVALANKCTRLAGQTSRRDIPKMAQLQVLGSRDPLTHSCIEPLPVFPVKTMLTYEMKVLMGQHLKKEYVLIGYTVYSITLNVLDKSVSISLGDR